MMIQVQFLFLSYKRFLLFQQIKKKTLMSQKKTLPTPRILGKQINLSQTTLNSLLNQKDFLLQEIKLNGCICLKNIDFGPKQIVTFTRHLWDQVLTLPKPLMFNNQDQIYYEVARVGNINVDGTLKDSQKEAAIWHQDGDFWGEGKKHIFNCLHTREIPNSGGQTYIMDLVEAANFLRKQQPFVLKKLRELVGILNMDSIDDFKKYNAKNNMDINSITHHNLVNTFNTDQQVLFLSVQYLAQRNDLNPSKDLTIQEVLNLLENKMGYYAHKWQKGDMLIWDNLQVMHRSSGSFEGRRLLLRTQGKFKTSNL